MSRASNSASIESIKSSSDCEASTLGVCPCGKAPRLRKARAINSVLVFISHLREIRGPKPPNPLKGYVVILTPLVVESAESFGHALMMRH
jgi:hypothetical protein